MPLQGVTSRCCRTSSYNRKSGNCCRSSCFAPSRSLQSGISGTCPEYDLHQKEVIERSFIGTSAHSCCCCFCVTLLLKRLLLLPLCALTLCRTMPHHFDQDIIHREVTSGGKFHAHEMPRAPFQNVRSSLGSSHDTASPRRSCVGRPQQRLASWLSRPPRVLHTELLHREGNSCAQSSARFLPPIGTIRAIALPELFRAR